MSNIIKYRENLISYIKSVILKYCPYVDDRLYILGNANSPALDIDISINDNESQIMFILGNSSAKMSVSDCAIASYVISFEEIEELIDFILEDHEVIKNMNIYGREFELKFAINWSDKSIKGIDCGDIGLRITVNNIELEREYLYLLFQKYYVNLEPLPFFKKIKNEYIDNVKQSYIAGLDKDKLISLLSKMNETDLRELLYNMDNDTFIKYVMNVWPESSKTLSLKKNDTND